MTARASALAYWRPNKRGESSKVALSVRLEPELHASLNELAAFWTELDAALLGDAALKTGVGDVITRLLEVGLAGAWTELGGRPESEKDRAALVKRAAALSKQQK